MKLNKKKVAVLGLAGLLALGGAGGALAYIIKNGDSKSDSKTTDSAFLVSFGEESIEGINFSSPDAVYTREITAKWAHSNTATNDVKIDFTLAKGATSGIVVEIDTTPWGASNPNKKTLLGSSTTEAGTTISYQYNSSTNEVIYSAGQQKFYLRFSIAEAARTTSTTYTGSLTCTVSPVISA